ncbi:multi-sensor signal transduction histidine kinase [Anaeromyxobacter sp. K]|uniref:GAF domain-containing protein n=1 Tax=Anaeromyxobacter sp. (strain K) TaxID=447217 RepID=UPI00015F84ED|nr:GAF domain-containing protein [Anaeromyxobacter sp. K]ACG71688.1 multi-sensor signal transduction histidine kinase [Anaeromyxobacter sp. K]
MAERFQAGSLVVRDRKIVHASEGAAALAGRTVPDMVGLDVLDLVAPEDVARVVERHERRLRGEAAPAEYEVGVLLPDGTRRPVELRVRVHGADVILEVRDATAQAARRPRLEALAALGAALQREPSEAAVLERLRGAADELSALVLLARPDGGGLRVDWSALPPPAAARLERALERPLDGQPGRWPPMFRAAWDAGAAYSDDLPNEAAAFVPEARAAATREAIAAIGIARAVAVRVDTRAGPALGLLVAARWLRSEDLGALRLFGAQLAAALDAARTIADLSRHNADLALLNRVGRLAGDAPDLDTFFGEVTTVLTSATGCAVVAVYLVEDGGRELVRTFASGTSPDVQARLQRVPVTARIGEVLRDRAARAVPVDDAESGADALRALGIRAGIWVPLVARGRAVGVMVVAFREALEAVRPWLGLLGAVGPHVASAVETQGLLGALRRRVAELTLINDVAMGSAQLDPVLLLDTSLRRVVETFQADTGAAFVREGERLALVAGHGLSAETLRRTARLGLGESLPGLAVKRCAPARYPDDADPTAVQVAQAEGLREAMAVPLLAKGQSAVGSIVLGRRTARPFADREVTLLSAMAVQIGVAVENARLFADVRRRLSDLEAVHALALRIFGNAPGDVPALLDDGCREVASALSCRGAAVLLVDPQERCLRGVGGWGGPLRAEALRIPAGQDLLAEDALRRGAPAWTEDASRDPRSALCGREDLPPTALLVVPLTSRQATRGVLFLLDDAGRSFSDPELALANALGGELAVGLENAELYAEASRRVEDLSLLNEMSRTVAGSLDLDHVLSEGVVAARRLLGAGVGVVHLYDPVHLSLRAAAVSPGGPAALERASAALASGEGLSWRSVRERRTFVVEDVDAEAAGLNRLLVEYHRARAAIVAPLLLRGEPLGVLVVVDTERPRRFAPAEVERVTAVANQLAVAIENARLYAEARGRLHELSTVIDVARVVSSSLDLEEVLSAGAEHLKQTLQGSDCTILLDDYRRRELRRAATRGAPIGPASVPLAERSLARDALEARTPIAGRLAEPGVPDRALLAVPLHVRDQPVGVALVAAATTDRTFSPGELSRAMAIASQLAVAVDNARLYSETRRRAEELGLLHEVGRSLVATLDFEQVLDAGVRNLARIVDAPRAVIALSSPGGEQLRVRAVWGLPQAAVGVDLSVEAAAPRLAALVFERREPIAIEDAARDPRVREDLSLDPSIRAMLGLPLLVRDRYIGAAVILETRGPRRFSPAEIERGAAIANQLAVAAENARLYEDLRRSYAELAHAQRQLIQQERLAALGELSAVVAHEVRNPLGVIFNSLGSLRRMLRPQGDARMLLDIVGEEADRLNRIVGDLLDFARPSTPEVRPEPLDRVVEEALATALAQNGQPIQIQREVDPALPQVPMDARLVRQAVVNVAVNAVQAMPRGGRLTVRLRRDGDAAVLELEDTGAGIPDEVRGRIFEPFFTTKASGTGLGLAVVRRIVEGHGGEVTVTSRPGAGTAFALRFPLTPLAGEDGGPVEKEAGIG